MRESRRRWLLVSVVVAAVLDDPITHRRSKRWAKRLFDGKRGKRLRTVLRFLSGLLLRIPLLPGVPTPMPALGLRIAPPIPPIPIPIPTPGPCPSSLSFRILPRLSAAAALAADADKDMALVAEEGRECGVLLLLDEG